MKKVFTVLLTIVLLLGIGVNRVFAEDAEPVAKIGETTYIDLRDALSACQSGQTVELLKDITLTESWVPFDGFKGTLDGKGYAINNLNIESETNLAGFFTELDYTIKNITFNNPKVTVNGNYSCAGIVAGYLCGNVSNVIVNNAVVSASGCPYVGGIAGKNDGYILDSSINNSNITGLEQVGGLVGYSASCTIKNNTLTNNIIEAKSERAGGIIGKLQFAGKENPNLDVVNNNTITGGSVTAPDMAGAIAGQLMGDKALYEIKNNNIVDVTLTAQKTSVIAVLRPEKITAFTSVLSTNIINNTWSKSTSDTNSYIYTNEVTGSGDKEIYNGVFDNKTLQLVLDYASEDTTIVLKENSQGYGKVYLRNNLKNAERTLKNIIIKPEEGKTINISQITTQENIEKTLYIDGLTIDGLQFKNLNNIAILLDGGSEEGNAKPSAKNIVIKNNTFDNCVSDNVQISGYQVDGTNKFTDNTLKNMSGRFVTISNAADSASFVFENNIVNNPQAYGSDGTIIKITGNEGFTVLDTNNDWDSGEYSQEQTVWNSIGPIAKASYFTFIAPTDLKYNNTGKTANLTTEKTTLGEVTIKYYDSKGNLLASAPKDVGTYNVKIDVAASDKTVEAKDVTDSSWTFAIAKREVTLTSGSSNKEYDGTPITNSTPLVVTGDGFVTGEGIKSQSITGSQTKVGESPNTFTYTLNDNTKESNYDITKSEGKLLVTPKELSVVGTIVSDKYYDGTTKADITEGTLIGVIDGDDVAINTTTAEYDSENVGKKIPVTISRTLKGNDKDNYIINDEKKEANILTVVDVSKSNVKADGNELTKKYNGNVNEDCKVDFGMTINTTQSTVKGEVTLTKTDHDTYLGNSIKISRQLTDGSFEDLVQDNEYTIKDGSILLDISKDYLKGLADTKNKFVISIIDNAGYERTYYLTTDISKNPSPSPSKKDESCEKVIGPTWHWNNKKGICEDSGSVHTYTR